METELFEFSGCSCSGKNLSRLVQPAVTALLAGESLHGYRLLELLAEEAIFRDQPPDPAGVYRLLKNMEQDGLISSDWELQSSGPARRLYTLTDRGRACLDQWLQTLTDYQTSIARVIVLLDKAARG